MSTHPDQADDALATAGESGDDRHPDPLWQALDDYQAGTTGLHAVRDVLEIRLGEEPALGDEVVHELKARYRDERIPLDVYLQLLTDLRRMVPEEEMATDARPRIPASDVEPDEDPDEEPEMGLASRLARRPGIAPSVPQRSPSQAKPGAKAAPQPASIPAAEPAGRVVTDVPHGSPPFPPPAAPVKEEKEEPGDAEPSTGASVAELAADSPVPARPGAEAPCTASVHTPIHAPIHGPGSIVAGRYRLEERVGQGGTGEVYRARDLVLEGLADDRATVAVKLISPVLRRDESLRAAVLRSALLMRGLRHENICQVHDVEPVGEDYAVVMEWLDGESLARRLDRAGHAALSPEEFRRMVRGVGAALEYAHARGIVHGDVKPGNVFLTSEGGIKLLDFGFAGDAGALSVDGSSFPRGVTAAYAGCEVLQGQAPQAVDDVYSMAALMYRMLAGASPYGLRDAVEAERAGVRLTRPPGLSSAEWSALAKALAPRRAQRLQDIRSLVAAFAGTATRPRRRGAWLLAGLLVPAAGLAWLYSEGRLDLPGLPAVDDGLVSLFRSEQPAGPAFVDAPKPVPAAVPREPGPATGGRDDGRDDGRDSDVIADDRATSPVAGAAAIATDSPNEAPPLPETSGTAPVTDGHASPGADAAGPSPTEAATPDEGGDVAVTPPTASPPPATAPALTPAASQADTATAPAVEVPPSPRPSVPAGPVVVGFAPGEDPVIYESEGFVRLHVRARGRLEGPVILAAGTRDGSARLGEDYMRPLAASLVLTPGNPAGEVLVPLISDSIPEHVEDFVVTLSIEEGNAVAGDMEVTVIVLDDS